MPSCGDVLLLSALHLDRSELEPLRRLIDPGCFLPADLAGRSHAFLANAILERRFDDAARATEMALRAAAGYRELGWPLYEARAMERPEKSPQRTLCSRPAARRADATAGTRASAAAGVTNKLSEREAAIARLIADGSGNPAIGEQLSISVKTVEKHVASIFEKLGVKSLLRSPRSSLGKDARTSSAEGNARILMTSRARFLGTVAAVAAANAFPTAIRAQARKPLSIGYVPSTLFAPVFVAVEKGYLRDAGFDASLSRSSPAPTR